MRFHTVVVSSLALAAASAGAQTVISTPRGAVGRAIAPTVVGYGASRAVIGVSTSISTGIRDTLGLLVSSVTRNGPAEKAGIEEGNRISMINGVSLRVAAADIGDPDMQRLMSRRLTRELDKVKPGEDVELKVYGGGQTRTIKVKTVDPEDLYETTRASTRRDYDERPSMGISIGSTGSKRDTLGVFVMSVDENGPAAKAGIEEGQRIASINGVDLRVSRDDAGDDMVSGTKLNRLERELGKVKVGDAVDLRVYANGQSRSVKVTTVAASSLHRSRTVRITGDGSVTMVRPPMSMGHIEIDGRAIGETVRRAVEKAQVTAGDRIEDVGRVLDELGRNLNGGTIRWFDEDLTTTKPSIAPQAATKAAPRRTIIMM